VRLGVFVCLACFAWKHSTQKASFFEEFGARTRTIPCGCPSVFPASRLFHFTSHFSLARKTRLAVPSFSHRSCVFNICSLCGCSVKIRTSCVRPSLMNAKRLTVSVFHHPRKSTAGIHPENFKDGCPITNVRHDAGGWRYPTHLSGMPAMGRSSRHMSF
jgi:hypothetical protein